MDLAIPSPQIKESHKRSDEIIQAVKVLYDVKREIISKIEETKRKIRNFDSKTSAKENRRSSIVVKDRTAALLDRDISHIQNIHDVVVQDLQCLNESLNKHVTIIEKTELIANILNYKLYEVQFQFCTQFDKLKARKESLTKPGLSGAAGEADTSAVVVLQSCQIDDEISKLEESHQKNLECIKAQKLDSQKAYERAVQVMDENFEKMTNGLNKLLVLIEAQKSTLSDSQAALVDSKFAGEVEEFRREIDKFTELQTTGWKILYPEEKISELLEERGLKVCRLGQLITADGQTITFKQAKDTHLFDDFTPDALHELRAQLMMDDTSPSSTSIGSSTGSSRMSSEDILYLKGCLGRPLALALAEITAIQPKDPIHYLGHWLFKYRYNRQMEDANKIEFDLLSEKRNAIAKERLHKFIEEEARIAVIDMIVKAEEIGFMNQLKRMQQEAAAMEEFDELDDEARDTLGPYNGPSKGKIPL